MFLVYLLVQHLVHLCLNHLGVWAQMRSLVLLELKAVHKLRCQALLRRLQGACFCSMPKGLGFPKASDLKD